MNARIAPAASAAPVPVSRTVLVLGALIVVLVLFVSLAGMLLDGGAGATEVRTVRGDAALLLGQGLYRHDTAFSGAGFRGTDYINVFLGVPALIASLLLYGRGSVRGGLALAGVVAYFLYVYANLALGAAYNPLFLAYVALLSASSFALVLLTRSLGGECLGAALARLPRRLPAVFFIVAGLVTSVVWLLPLVQALAAGDAPARMGTSSTPVTYALDLAFIVPACFITARLVLRRAALGYVLAAALLGIVVFLGPGFCAQTVMQVRAGVLFTPGEMLGPIGGFGLVAAAAAWVSIALLAALPANRSAPSDRPPTRESVSDAPRIV